MEALKKQNAIIPKRIQVDKGSEFIEDFDKWAYENEVTLDYSRLSQPTIPSLNRSTEVFEMNV